MHPRVELPPGRGGLQRGRRAAALEEGRGKNVAKTGGKHGKNQGKTMGKHMKYLEIYGIFGDFLKNPWKN